MLRLLVVEDSPTILALIDAILSTEPGYFNITFVTTKSHFLTAYVPLKPDIVLLDLILPDDSGASLLKEVIAIIDNACPLVIITAGSSELSREQAFSLGATDYILKSEIDPLTLSSILNKIADQFRLNKSLQQAKDLQNVLARTTGG